MELYLQFGHGMIGLANELIGNWGAGGVILSPRDLTQDQLTKLGQGVLKKNGEPLFDPQCFVRDANHHRLTGYRYWQMFAAASSRSFNKGSGIDEALVEIATINEAIGATRYIIPGVLAKPVSSDWFSIHEKIIDNAHQRFGDVSSLATIAISVTSLKDEAQVEAIVERAGEWPVSGFYIVAESTDKKYLSDEPSWLANLLILVSGLKLHGASVMVGYCNQQSLCLAAANADVIASGTWLNVRSFSDGKFYMPEVGDISRRATWYYCPQALTEYKIPFLDIAQRNGVLDLLMPEASFTSQYAAPLFGGATPTSVEWKEPQAFRHYITCLRTQARVFTHSDFDQTLNYVNNQLDRAETLTRDLASNGVLSSRRSISDVSDETRSALITFAKEMRPRLRRNWS
ncbi:MAG: hypothetical protein R8K20_10705 [Gallionellaceae bacterium]